MTVATFMILFLIIGPIIANIWVMHQMPHSLDELMIVAVSSLIMAAGLAWILTPMMMIGG